MRITKDIYWPELQKLNLKEHGLNTVISRIVVFLNKMRRTIANRDSKIAQAVNAADIEVVTAVPAAKPEFGEPGLKLFYNDGTYRLYVYVDGAWRFIDLGEDIASRLTALETVDDWIEPTLLNGWTNYGLPYGNAAFRKDPLGLVHFRGLITGGALTAAVFRLPEGYRPAYRNLFHVFSSGGAVRLDVVADGYVLNFATDNGWISIAGITFKAA